MAFIFRTKTSITKPRSKYYRLGWLIQHEKPLPLPDVPDTPPVEIKILDPDLQTLAAGGSRRTQRHQYFAAAQ